jgi:hypothetical protein
MMSLRAFDERSCGNAEDPQMFPNRLYPPGLLLFQAMSSAFPNPKPAKRRAAKVHPLLVGAQVRLHSKDVTGVIIGSIDSSRVRVRWDDTGEVTTCPRAKLAPLR